MNRTALAPTLLAIFLLLATGAVLFSSPSDVSGEGVHFRSEKPRCAKIVLTQDASKVLSVAFDESKGTGRGYDLLYADIGFSGNFENARKVKGRTDSQAGYFSCSFGPIKLNVPYNENGKGVPIPCQIWFNYSRYPTSRNLSLVRLPPSGPPRGSFVENFSIITNVSLRQGTDVWEYSFSGPIQPSQSLEKAPVWSFKRAPAAAIATQPDVNKKGHWGIAFSLSSGGIPIEFKKASSAVKAHLEVRRPDGKVVHRDDVTLDKLVFG